MRHKSEASVFLDTASFIHPFRTLVYNSRVHSCLSVVTNTPIGLIHLNRSDQTAEPPCSMTRNLLILASSWLSSNFVPTSIKEEACQDRIEKRTARIGQVKEIGADGRA